MAKSKVLICDDDPTIVDLIEIIVSDLGYDAITIHNSLEVIKTVKNSRPDLVIIDLWMPLISGDIILQNLRNDPEIASIPVIVISAARDGESIASKNGASDFLAKPFDLNNLISMINKYCSA